MVERISIIVVTAGLIGLGYLGYQYLVDVDEPEEITVSEVSEAPVDYSMEQVGERDSADECWVVINDVVYDFTDYIAEHPGGEVNVIDTCGTDASEVFSGDRSPHSQDNLQRLETYIVGEMQ